MSAVIDPTSPDAFSTANAGALDGVRVLDVSSSIAGAVLTMLLADNGADVLMVEPPGGRRHRTAGPAAGWTRTWDRGKRSVVVDPDAPADRTLLLQLADGADIVVVPAEGDLLETCGTSAEALRRQQPGSIVCVLHGGLDAAGRDLADGVLAAAHYGVFAESPGNREGPIFPGHPAHEYGTAMIATIGVLAALRARLVTGVGDTLDVSYRDGVLAQMGMNWWSERKLSFIQSRGRNGRLDMGRRRLLLERYRCADDSIVQVHTGAAGAFARAMEAFGLADRISKAESGVETASELTDADLDILRTELPALFRAQLPEYWMERLWRHEVACLPIQRPGAVFTDEQVAHAGLMTTVSSAVDVGDVASDLREPLEVVGPVVRMSDSPGSIRGPVPHVDEHGDAVRRAAWTAAGLGSPDLTSAQPLAHPLEGVRLLEFSNWFASPSGNRHLRDLGAEVIKVEALQGDSIRPLPDPCEGANGGKRSIAIDLKAPAARPILERLMATSDVVQHNMRPGTAERLGLDEASARAANPAVVYAYGPGYGSSGPKSRLQSFAPLLSGFVGLMRIAAGEGDEPHTCFGNEDYYAGLLGAVGILLGLVHRERTGRGQYVEVPQLLSSVFVTSEHFVRNGAVESALPVLDRDEMGWSAGYRMYQCLEGWIVVACTSDAQVDALAAAVLGDSAGSARDDDRALAEALTNELFGRTAADWVDLLTGAGVPTTVVREEAWLGEFLLDDAHIADGTAIELEHPLHGRVRVIGEIVHLREHPGRVRTRSPLLGEHSLEIVAELGFTAAEIDAIERGGVIGGGALVPAP